MSRPVITVEGLGKSYRLGRKADPFPSFREALAGAALAPVRRLRGIAKPRRAAYETFWALRDVSFEVKSGEVVGIIGRNGAGKSTLLKILSRITEPTEGNARLRGRIASLLEIGTGFHPELTGRENIYLNGSILGMRKSEIDRKFDEIVAFAEIERFLDTPVKYYSSGMSVRLAFAVAAHLDPEILIIDEVLAVGDSEFQKKCLGKMKQITSTGGGDRTVLFVSHNIGAVRSLCTSCRVLRRGGLIFDGDVETGVELYLQSVGQEGVRTSREFVQPEPGVPWMKSAALSTGDGFDGVLEMGDRLYLTVDFASPRPMSEPKIGFIITGSDDLSILGSNNKFLPTDGPVRPTANGRICCDLGVLPLMPGRYSISLFFGGPGTHSHSESDALSFEVIEHDAWGTGTLPHPDLGRMWWPAHYRIEPLPEDPVV
jgi:lipopolysaccharide transport system ATP-binding protein